MAHRFTFNIPDELYAFLCEEKKKLGTANMTEIINGIIGLYATEARFVRAVKTWDKIRMNFPVVAQLVSDEVHK